MRKVILVTVFLVATIAGFAQVGIGTSNPNASSVLDLTSTNKAFLPPRMTTAQQTAIANPVAGMVVFNTDSSCIEIYRGTSWFNVCTGTSSGSGGLPSIDGFTSSNQVAAANLAAYWPFDNSTTENNSGKAPALSGGTISYVAGKLGTAAHFNNAWLTYPSTATWASPDNSVGSVGNNDTLKNGFTISMWMQVPDTSLLTNAFCLVSPNIPNYPLMGIWYRKHAGNIFDFDGGAGTVDKNGPTIDYADFQAGGKYTFKDSLTWAFIAMVYDTASHSLLYYANNIKIATVALPAPTNSEPLLMIAPNYATFGTVEGYQRTPGDNNSANTVPLYISDGLTGNIDDVRLFNKTLTAQQLSDLYQLGNQGR
jgi:hypothetical protein